MKEIQFWNKTTMQPVFNQMSSNWQQLRSQKRAQRKKTHIYIHTLLETLQFYELHFGVKVTHQTNAIHLCQAARLSLLRARCFSASQLSPVARHLIECRLHSLFVPKLDFFRNLLDAVFFWKFFPSSFFSLL